MLISRTWSFETVADDPVKIICSSKCKKNATTPESFIFVRGLNHMNDRKHDVN